MKWFCPKSVTPPFLCEAAVDGHCGCCGRDMQAPALVGADAVCVQRACAPREHIDDLDRPGFCMWCGEPMQPGAKSAPLVVALRPDLEAPLQGRTSLGPPLALPSLIGNPPEGASKWLAAILRNCGREFGGERGIAADAVMLPRLLGVLTSVLSAAEAKEISDLFLKRRR